MVLLNQPVSRFPHLKNLLKSSRQSHHQPLLKLLITNYQTQARSISLDNSRWQTPIKVSFLAIGVAFLALKILCLDLEAPSKTNLKESNSMCGFPKTTFRWFSTEGLTGSSPCMTWKISLSLIGPAKSCKQK